MLDQPGALRSECVPFVACQVSELRGEILPVQLLGSMLPQGVRLLQRSEVEVPLVEAVLFSLSGSHFWPRVFGSDARQFGSRPQGRSTNTAAATTVVHNPSRSPIADWVTLRVVTILSDIRQMFLRSS